MRLKGTLIACVTALLLTAAAAQPQGEEQPFAALVITSHGRQTIDITTGLTTLPDGGKLTDTKTGVEVSAEVIQYLDGAYIEAAGVSVTGAFGDFSADALHIDVVGSVLTASGELELDRDGLLITAGLLRYHALEQVIVFEGGVQGSEPAFAADRVLLDAVTGDVLLDGRYTFVGDLFTMRSPEAGGQLQLVLSRKGEQHVYGAATEVSPALLERFRAYL